MVRRDACSGSVARAVALAMACGVAVAGCGELSQAEVRERWKDPAQRSDVATELSGTDTLNGLTKREVEQLMPGGRLDPYQPADAPALYWARTCSGPPGCFVLRAYLVNGRVARIESTASG